MPKRNELRKAGKNLIIFLIILLLGLLKMKAQQVYFEDFSGYGNGADASSRWMIDTTAASPQIFNVQNAKFTAVNLNGEAVWTSSDIDISAFADCRAAVSIMETGKMEKNDFIRVYYKVDDGAEILFEQNGDLSGEFGTAIASQAGLQGFTLQIIIRASNDHKKEKFTFDDVVVENNKTSEVAIFTSAADNNINLKVEPAVSKMDLLFYNQNGEICYHKCFLNMDRSSFLSFNLRDKLSPGIYYMQISMSDNNVIIHKIVIS